MSKSTNVVSYICYFRYGVTCANDCNRLTGFTDTQTYRQTHRHTDIQTHSRTDKPIDVYNIPVIAMGPWQRFGKIPVIAMGPWQRFCNISLIAMAMILQTVPLICCHTKHLAKMRPCLISDTWHLTNPSSSVSDLHSANTVLITPTRNNSERTVGHVDRRTDGRTDERTDGRANGRTKGQTD